MMSDQIDIADTCCKLTCCADGCCSEGCKTGECSTSCCRDGCCIDSDNCCWNNKKPFFKVSSLELQRKFWDFEKSYLYLFTAVFKSIPPQTEYLLLWVQSL